jgi:hypothetical protein
MQPPPLTRRARDRWDQKPRLAVSLGWVCLAASLFLLVPNAWLLVAGGSGNKALPAAVSATSLVLLIWSGWLVAAYRGSAKHGSNPPVW